jgi:hypothetical protein
MAYFLTVRKKDGALLHDREKYPALEAALQTVSRNYLADAQWPRRWNGYFAIRNGELTRLYLTQGTTAAPLRDDIARIDIMNERGLLETKTHETQASQ